MERGNQNWLYNCEYVMEVPMPGRGAALPAGQESVHRRLCAKKFGLPFEAVFGGRRTTYPEYMPKLEAADERGSMTARAARPPRALTVSRSSRARRRSAASRPVETFHVQATSTCWSGAGANIAVQIGDEGVLVVDTGRRPMREKVLAAIRQTSDKPIRWIDQHARGRGSHRRQRNHVASRHDRQRQPGRDHRARKRAGADDGGRIARSRSGRSTRSSKTERDFSFNGEAIFLYHVPTATPTATSSFISAARTFWSPATSS